MNLYGLNRTAASRSRSRPRAHYLQIFGRKLPADVFYVSTDGYTRIRIGDGVATDRFVVAAPTEEQGYKVLHAGPASLPTAVTNEMTTPNALKFSPRYNAGEWFNSFYKKTAFHRGSGQPFHDLYPSISEREAQTHLPPWRVTGRLLRVKDRNDHNANSRPSVDSKPGDSRRAGGVSPEGTTTNGSSRRLRTSSSRRRRHQSAATDRTAPAWVKHADVHCTLLTPGVGTTTPFKAGGGQGAGIRLPNRTGGLQAPSKARAKCEQSFVAYGVTE
ncbi:hypothetical protein EVAR_90165_1 [Eumeta japonica]|uniref:Uncharacterized protein n=1 Tax=Eumeta variegata TaxID=151549 RepID=A0A4C1WYJ0_EUMVA|nr:hypothetical protein EVAR_90165_1 [Eumeta japonica]